ncbi:MULTISPECIES: hypothetical protein [Cupriavidus]
MRHLKSNALAVLAAMMLAMPLAYASGTPVAPQAPVAGQPMCGVGSGIALSGTGKLTCSQPTMVQSGASEAQSAVAVPCQLANVRIDGVLTVECDRMKATATRGR